MQKKFTLQKPNRQKLVGVCHVPDKPMGLPVILCHGIFASHREKQIRETARRLEQSGFTAYRFSATNNLGTSSGHILDFTVGNYIDDIRSVRDYVLKDAASDRFFLIGFSIGAMASYLYAKDDPRIQGLVLQAPPYDLHRVFEHQPAYSLYQQLSDWLSNRPSRARFKKLQPEFFHQADRYDVDAHLRAIQVPTLVVYGEKDAWMSKTATRTLVEKLGGPKELKVLDGLGHTLRRKKNIAVLAETIVQWLKEH